MTNKDDYNYNENGHYNGGSDKERAKLYRNLVMLLKVFKNRPNHLAQYLIDNSALDINFTNNIINSEKLNNIDNELPGHFTDFNLDEPYFSSYDQMNNYYNEIIIQDLNSLQDPNKIEANLNEKLASLLNKEDYEQASNLRDYIKNNGFQIKLTRSSSDGIYRLREE